MIDLAEINSDEDLARRVRAYARTIAPCLDSLTGEAAKDALAILKAVAAEMKASGPRHIKGQSIGPARIEYRDIASAFSPDDRASLSAMCSIASGSAGAPVGSFPTDRPAGRLWPERY